jgi:hypothetical protein
MKRLIVLLILAATFGLFAQCNAAIRKVAPPSLSGFAQLAPPDFRRYVTIRKFEHLTAPILQVRFYVLERLVIVHVYTKTPAGSLRHLIYADLSGAGNWAILSDAGFRLWIQGIRWSAPFELQMRRPVL